MVLTNLRKAVSRPIFNNNWSVSESLASSGSSDFMRKSPDRVLLLEIRKLLLKISLDFLLRFVLRQNEDNFFN